LIELDTNRRISMKCGQHKSYADHRTLGAARAFGVGQRVSRPIRENDIGARLCSIPPSISKGDKLNDRLASGTVVLP
jgi:hypothetical protein